MASSDFLIHSCYLLWWEGFNNKMESAKIKKWEEAIICTVKLRVVDRSTIQFWKQYNISIKFPHDKHSKNEGVLLKPSQNKKGQKKFLAAPFLIPFLQLAAKKKESKTV